MLLTEDEYEDIVNAVLTFDSDEVSEATKRALVRGDDPVNIINNGLAKALRIVGKKFEDGEFFLMHLVAAAEPVQKAIERYLNPSLQRGKSIGRASAKLCSARSLETSTI
jgi:trimethylamine corrinoid protein